ncbi:CHAT domain-containing protein [Actinokineospora sp. 24-640]
MSSIPESRRGPVRDRVLRRAGRFQRQARQALYAYRFADARSALRAALSALDAVDHTGDAELTAMRVQVLVSLAYSDSEGAGRGLGALDAAAELLKLIPEGPRLLELRGLVAQQRGFLLIRAGRGGEGMRLLDSAVRDLETGLSMGVGDPDVLAGLHVNRSLVFIERADTAGAVAELRRSVDLAERYDLNPVGIKARHNIGYIAYMTGDLPTALRDFERVAQECLVRAPSLLPVVRLDQARALLAAGLPQEAARHLADALPMLRKQRAGQDAAEVEVTLAASALLDDRVRDARKWARSAERRFIRRGNQRWAAVAALAGLRAETATALTAGRVPASLPAVAVKLAEELRGLGLVDETALALMLAVRLELRRGDREAARSMLAQVPRPRPTTPVDHRMLLRLCRAELAVADANRRGALAQARAGLTELGSARDRMGGLDLVCGTAVHGRQLGELAVRLVLGGQPRTLFGWLERTRAQVYRYEPLPEIDDPGIAQKAAELRRSRREAQLARLAGRAVAPLEKQAAALEREVARMGWYASQWGRPKPVATLDTVAEALGSAALVEFASSGGDLVAVVVAGGSVRMVRLGSMARAAEWAARLYNDLNALAPDVLPPPIAAVVRDCAVRSAGTLDELLVHPLLPVIGDRDLVVVPTGELYAVQWGSLPSLVGRPVVVAPSATAWHTAATAPPGPDGPVLLARGPNLTGRVVEGTSLRGIYPDAVDLEGPAATVAEVLSALDGASLAHVAAHGEHESTNALFSQLDLADGPLFAYEVARLQRPPRQVVLAACELALSYVRPGDEALGYAGALLAAGVRTVVAATSRVGDEAAATAMVDYHQRLRSGLSPARALAESVAVDPYRRPFVCLGSG